MVSTGEPKWVTQTTPNMARIRLKMARIGCFEARILPAFDFKRFSQKSAINRRNYF